jgi:hypothetical protein
MPRKPKPLLERFELRLPDQLRDDECWTWQGCKNRYGYGVIVNRRRPLLAHRVAWEAHHAEPIPPGACICHSCDNRACVNPAHLFLGTNSDNVADMVAKSRQARGSSNSKARLTEGRVREIRALYGKGDITLHQLSRRFGVSHAAIHYAVTRQTWRHVH